MPSQILVATDGKPGALGALRMARLFAEREATRVEVVAVFESIDLYAGGSPHAVASLPPHYIPAAIEALRSRVRTQLVEVGPTAADWPLSVELGPVAATIARTAAKQSVDLILLGLRQATSLERWLARETLLRLVHLSHVPVLAVPEHVKELPRQVVLAVDFSELSLRAADEVIEVLAPGAQLNLAHVTWLPVWREGNVDESQLTEWEKPYHAGVQRRLEEFSSRFGDAVETTVKTHILAGDPGPELLRLAEEIDADLIAAGSHGAGFLGRIVLGSVSGKLVHGARCSLLIAPPRMVPAELGVEELGERELLANLGTAGELALSESP